MRHFIVAAALFLGSMGFAAQAADPPALAHGDHAAAPVTGPTQVNISGPSGAVTLTIADLAALPHVTLNASFHGKAYRFSGVPLTAILAKVGAPSGEALRGKALTSYVVITCADGYRLVLSLAETDAGVRSAAVILADEEGGRPLAAGDGPLRLVVEGDLKPVRSARMVSAIAIRSLD